MKFLLALLSSFSVAPMQTLAVVNDWSNIEKIMGERWFRFKPNIKIIDSNLEEKHFVKGNEKKRKISPEAPIQILLNEEQDNYLNDNRFENMRISIKYSLSLTNKKIRASNTCVEDFDYELNSKNGVKTKLKAEDGTTKEFLISTDNPVTKVMKNFKNNRTALQLKPTIESLDMDINDWKSSKGYGTIEWKIEEISFIGMGHFYDLDKVKMVPLDLKYIMGFTDEIDDLRTIVENDLYKKMCEIYNWPKDFVNRIESRKTLYLDEVGKKEGDTYSVKIVPNDKYFVTGSFTQEFTFKASNYETGTIMKMRNITTSNVYEMLIKHGIETSVFNLTIQLEPNGLGTPMYFRAPELGDSNDYAITYYINDGPLLNANKFKSVSIVQGEEILGTFENDKWSIKNYEKIGNLADDYFNDKKQDVVSDVKDEKPKDVKSSNDDYEDEIPQEEEPQNEDTKSESNPLKYLWLLAIPIAFGLVSLISWFIPFRKKKKRANDIK